MKSYVLCDEDGNILPVYSISAGLDYPGIGPEHAYLNDIKRAKYTYITDDEAVNENRRNNTSFRIITCSSLCYEVGRKII